MYDDKTFPEFAACRNKKGKCTICKAKRGEEHDIRAHDDWDAADDATW